MKTTLSCWLRLLWDMEPPLRLDGDVPRIIDGAIHLPVRGRWTDHTAAAAHATAHLIYSPSRFDGDGLGPIVRSVLALLEDARVEALAIRELPGLARLWRPLHTATPATGEGFEGLLERLARSLIDPAYDDPSPWVRKGRSLFYLDVGLGLPALRTPLELRSAAMRLGHDIGQMRMQFDSRGYVARPRYRDDHRWMWAADALDHVAPAASSSADGRGPVGDAVDEEVDDAGESVTCHPEWDRLISRLRPDWCRVSERPASSNAASAAEVADVDPATRRIGDRLRAPLRSLTRQATSLRRQDQGDVFDLAALVDRGIARRVGIASDGRVYRGRRQRASSAVVWLLIDQSASTATRHGADDGNALDTVVRAAIATTRALRQLGVAFAVGGFSSNGRHDIRMRLVKDFDASNDHDCIVGLRRLRPGGSTRLGAALRHATGRLAARDGAQRLLLVLSDGRPHDVDVHDPHYLVDDARYAVRQAARTSVRAICLVFASDGSDQARRIFGRGGVQRIGDASDASLEDLPGAIARLLD